MKKTLLSLTLLLSLVFSCGKTEKANDAVVKVGVPLPLTGDLAQYGQAIKEGIELKIDSINEKGGVNGKKFEVEYVDSKGDIQENINIFKKMASNKVDFIIGEAISANTLAIAELANKAKIPMIAPSATAMSVTKDKENVFRTTFTDPYQGEVIAKYLAKNGVTSVAVLENSSSDYSTGVVEAFNKQAKELGIEVYVLNYTKEDNDFKSLLTDVKNKGLTNVFVPDYYNTVGLILSQAKEVNLVANFYGADGWDGIQENFAKVAEGAVFASQFVDDETLDQTKDFVKEYKDKYKKSPSIFVALGYDSATILADVVSKGKDPIQALKETDLDLVTGHVRFDENRNPKKEVLFVQVKDGKLVLKEKFGDK